jgi:hypothetical protein
MLEIVCALSSDKGKGHCTRWQNTPSASGNLKVLTMTSRHASASRFIFRALLGAAVLCAAMSAGATPYYLPITPSMNDRTVTLNGHDLTIDQIVMVARYGAKVELSAEARHTQADRFGLLLEAAAEGIPVYWFNRRAGEAYFQGVRMKADQALKNAGLTSIQPFAADDNALTSSNAYATGQSALLVHDAREALEWTDLIYA